MSSKRSLPKLARGLCVTRCYYAKNKRCKCKCKGKLHGLGAKKDLQKDVVPEPPFNSTWDDPSAPIGGVEGRPGVLDGVDAPLVDRADLRRFFQE